MTIEDGTAKGAIHYQGKGDQPIEIMQNKMTHEQFIGFLRGNVIKYILRIGCKDDDIKDAQKAAQYATWLCQALNGETINPMKDKNVLWRSGDGDIELIKNKKNEINCATFIAKPINAMENKIKPEFAEWGTEEGKMIWNKMCYDEYAPTGTTFGIGGIECLIHGEEIKKGDVIIYRGKGDIELIKKENKNCSTCGNNVNNIDCKAHIYSMKYGLPRWTPKER